MIRESIARQSDAPIQPPLNVSPSFAHPSFARLPLVRANVDGSCLIEPSVRCNHCGYCLSYGH